MYSLGTERDLAVPDSGTELKPLRRKLEEGKGSAQNAFMNIFGHRKRLNGITCTRGRCSCCWGVLVCCVQGDM